MVFTAPVTSFHFNRLRYFAKECFKNVDKSRDTSYKSNFSTMIFKKVVLKLLCL